MEIGSWTVPDTLGNLNNNGVGFAEYYFYPGPGTLDSCSKLIKYNVFYGPVTTTDYGGGIGDTTIGYEYGTDCKAEMSNYSTKPEAVTVTLQNGSKLTGNGVHLIRGWIAQKQD